MRHVQKCATPVQKNAQVSPEWNFVKHSADNAQILAANVQKNAEMVILNPFNNVLMLVVLVLRNAKSMIVIIVNIVPKNAENAKQNVEKWLLNYLVIQQAICIYQCR